MSATVTQDNLYLIIPAKIRWIAPWLARDMKISVADAVLRIYDTELYQKLATENTKFWHYGPVDLYRMIKEEMGIRKT